MVFKDSTKLYLFYCIVDHATIDKINIRQATIIACERAAHHLSYIPSSYYVDGNMKFKNKKYISIIKDNKYIEIASASIIAKVTRDFFVIV